jgi:two-component system, NarL family, nitrate/nitrite response regulator NarL
MRIAICDDHRTFGEAVGNLLEDRGHRVVAHATTPYEFTVGESEPDVVLVDLDFPDVDYGDSVAILRSALPETGIVVLTAMADTVLLDHALSRGADGLALKTDGIDEIESVLTKVLEAKDSSHESPGNPIRSRKIRAMRQTRSAARLPSVTARELDVLNGLAAGRTTADLSTRLGVAEVTVRTHIQRLFTKFNVHSRVEVVAAAIRHGLPLQMSGRSNRSSETAPHGP